MTSTDVPDGNYGVLANTYACPDAAQADARCIKSVYFYSEKAGRSVEVLANGTVRMIEKGSPVAICGEPKDVEQLKELKPPPPATGTCSGGAATGGSSAWIVPGWGRDVNQNDKLAPQFGLPNQIVDV